MAGHEYDYVGSQEHGDFAWAIWRRPDGSHQYTKTLLNTAGAQPEEIEHHDMPVDVQQHLGFLILCTGTPAKPPQDYKGQSLHSGSGIGQYDEYMQP